MLFVSKNCSLEKVAFRNSSCFMICELNWIVFMAIVKHFLVKMRLASSGVLTELNREFVFAVCRVTLISTLKITSRTYFLRRISF